MSVKKPIIHCDALVVHCMDYRLQKFLQPWITVRFGYDNFDIISLAGGVHDYEMVLKYVQLAVQIHSIDTVCLINHEDCRAYGREGTYKRHKHDLQDAQAKIKALFPALNVETFYLHLDGTFEYLTNAKGINIMTHKCEAIVVHCMDYRLQSYINQWLETNLGKSTYDRAVMAGGVYDVYDVIRQVDISARLHGISKVILINHEDCGMYGPGGTEERHEDDLDKAEDKIKRLFPHLEVDTYYLNLDGTFEQNS